MELVLPGTPTEVQIDSPTGALMRIIDRAASDPNFDVAKLQQLLEVKERWDAAEAKKAYVTAFAAFKSTALRIIKNRGITDGPLKGKRYADLFAVVDAIVPTLSRYGLSHSWSIVKDEKDWIEVACILTHVGGHSETRTMGGPPDAGGAKNAIQARASTVSYLERYSFLAIVGMAATDQDDDGRGGQEEEKPDPWTDAFKKTGGEAAEKGIKSYEKWWRAQDMDWRDLAAGTQQHLDFKATASEVGQ